MNKEVQEHRKVVDELNELYAQKNRDYGDSFHTTYEEFGIVTAMTRMLDKWNRIKKLVKTGVVLVKGESLRDSLVDLANYAIMTIMELDREEKAKVTEVTTRYYEDQVKEHNLSGE